MSFLGLIPPKSDPMTDLPGRRSCGGMPIGAMLPMTPSRIVFPHPWKRRNSDQLTVPSYYTSREIETNCFAPDLHSKYLPFESFGRLPP